MDKKIAIVCSWGGMRCSYTGGFLVGLGKRFPDFKPDIMIATSWGAGCAAYYLSHQLWEMERIWTEHLANPGFINPLKIRKIMNIDYAIDVVLRRIEPLDTGKILATQTKWYIVVTEVVSWIPFYFSQEDTKEKDHIFDFIQASMSVPLLYGKKIIYGTSYIDGGFGASFYKTVEKAVEFGATHILAIDASRSQSEDFDSLWSEGISIELIRNQKIPAKLLTHSKKILTESFELGLRDAINHPWLTKLFERPTWDSSQIDVDSCAKVL